MPLYCSKRALAGSTSAGSACMYLPPADTAPAAFAASLESFAIVVGALAVAVAGGAAVR